MAIWRFLGVAKKGERSDLQTAPLRDTETVRKIVAALEQLPPERARHIAMFAYLLSRVAHADLDISKQETLAMERIVAEHGGLPEEQAVLVVQMAKAHNRLFGGTENFLVAREFNRSATHEDKLHLLDCLYAISSADKDISNVEDAEIRKIARELRLEHPDFIAVRLRYRKHLSVMKGLPKKQSEEKGDF